MKIPDGQHAEEMQSYSEFQLAKLKGFCCMQNNSNLPPIWDYFKSRKEVDVQCTQLLKLMKD